ncbi:MAG: hypothetical protein HN348_09610 [Proteobacteria bacterium]|jgi:DNA-binding transcriptional MerR regulator|nr:hypothetical protein [Pseudomonadota bacterium]
MQHILNRYCNREYELSELESAARELLRQCGPGIGDDRVALFPDSRTLRYYQSLGIMNRPVRYDSRTAIYGYISLLQGVCVKLLQSRGFSLAQVQNALKGATVTKLESAILEAMGVGTTAELIEPASQPLPPPVHDRRPGVPLPAPTPSTAPEMTRRLVSVEVVPGVVVTIDPQKIEKPEDIIRHITNSLANTPFSNPGEFS